MILDKQAIFSDKQAITQTVASTNTIDLGATSSPRDLGKGTKVPLLVQVTTAFAGLTSLKIELQTATDTAFTTPKILASQTLPQAELQKGARMSLPVVPYGATERYLRLRYTVSGTGTAGAITAGITMGNDENLPY